MTDEQLDRYLELCKRVFDQMRAEGSWPWRDSQNAEDVLDSEDNPNDL